MPPQLINPWLAVQPLGDRVAQALALRRIHEAFHAGKDVGGSVRAVVAQSWARSGEAGLNPVDHLPPILMDEREIDDRWSHHALYPVLPMLRELLTGATSESGHMLVISDARGVLMWIEGHHRVVEATENMHLVCGADWSESGAGTNALGTAIAVDHPVQIFSAEHFNRIVHPWQCSGAPIHDPVTGDILGVIDLTGHLRTAHPHTLSLVTAAAGMAEAYLRHDRLRQDQAMREAYRERVAGVSQPTALVRPSGHVVTALPSDWLPPLVAPPQAGRELALPDGQVADVEALPGVDGLVVWRRRSGARAPQAPAAARLELLGRHPRIVLPDGQAVPLAGRHAEILAILLLHRRGLTSRELTLDLYGEAGKLVTLRAEMSRLRRSLPGLLLTRPYRFAVPVSSDLDEADRRLGADEQLLPDSVAPAIVEARSQREPRPVS